MDIQIHTPVAELPEIRQMQIPTPFRVGAVNIYLMGDTLIDTGPLTPFTLQRVMEVLDTNIDTILITHGHVDHHGLAFQIKTRMGCSVLVHQYDQNVVTEYPHEILHKLQAYKIFLKKAGISKKMIDSFQTIYVSYRQYGEPCTTHLLNETVNTSLGSLKVVHTPGHTAGSVCFLLDDVLFSGDTLLPTISTNPSIHALFDERCGLRAYQSSLHILKSLPVSLVLPGHGALIEDHKKRIREILQEHSERRLQVLESLHNGPRSLIDIQNAVFGPVHPSALVLALSECYDHLCLLEKEDIIERVIDEPLHFDLL
jgi:glyoxylase-like metal-dependent hydrolase (beta-lactamase superfamily II)